MKKKNKKPLLSAIDITIRIRDALFFEHTSWQINDGEQWVILGPNGAGKSIFAKALAGIIPLKHGEIVCKKRISYLSFDTQQQIISKEEKRLDLESSIGKGSYEKTVKQFLGLKYKNFSYKNEFSTDELLNQPVRSLSTGEMRKVFIVKTLLENPGLLILDEPFDGLDSAAKKILGTMISTLMQTKQVILITHQTDEIPKKTTHVLIMNGCHIYQQGEKDVILQKYFLPSKPANNDITKKNIAKPKHTDILISMQDVTVKYHDKTILNNISWVVRKGENWALLGPNGAGKSTLMHLITGDNQQSYANYIHLFGKRKGAGISIWDIKKHIGIVSSDLMLRYDKQIRAFDVILSGFFDSIGLYRKTTVKQNLAAKKIIDKLKLQSLVNKNYHQLSFGQKRLILIARAIVKSPDLLILDEPFHGLDLEKKKLVYEKLNSIGNSGKTNIILITHNESEILPCIKNKLIFEKVKVTQHMLYD